MNLQFDIIAIESLIVEILNPDFLAINYDLSYGNIRLHVVVGDERYRKVEKIKGINEILALINLNYPDIFKDYELIVEVFNNDDIIDYIDILKKEEMNE